MATPPDDSSFADLLQAFRLRRGLSQRGLAAEAGLNAKTVSAYEQGQTVPRSLAALEVLGDVLRLDDSQRHALLDARARFLEARRVAMAAVTPAAVPSGVQTVAVGGMVGQHPAYLAQVVDGCRRLGLTPLVGDPRGSERLEPVARADFFVGVYPVEADDGPKEAEVAALEEEYDLVVARALPRLVVLVERTGSGSRGARGPETITAWGRLLERVAEDHDVRRVDTPEALRAVVFAVLAPLRRLNAADREPVRPIPARPAPYVAHPYLLLQTPRLIGRTAELRRLDRWVAPRSEPRDAVRVLSVIAVGGMGKSALTWAWFARHAAAPDSPFAGAIWWSFYDQDAHFDSFVLRALAYLTGTTPEALARERTPDERAHLLLDLLDQIPVLVVLDGLERLLLAYARMDAARLADDDLDAHTANPQSLPPIPQFPAADTRHRLRRTIDPRVGRFLRRLTAVRTSRTLISSRLLPADLQGSTGHPLPGSDVLFLQGLRGHDSLALWRALGVEGSGDRLLPLFDSFDHHPLLIQVLAGVVARDRHRPGDFDRWRQGHPDFDPFGLPIAERATHILAYALGGITPSSRAVLELAAAFRTPVRYAALASQFVGKRRLFRSDEGLDQALTDIEDRGLLGWDRPTNRYDLHPVVRGVVWRTTDDARQREAYEALHAYFGARARLDDWQQVVAIDDLADVVELYHALAGLKRYDEAWQLFSHQLGNALLYRLGANRERAELLELLFPDGLDQPPRLGDEFAQVYTCSALVQSYAESGQCGRAAAFFQKHQEAAQSEIGMVNPGDLLWPIGQLFQAELEARNALYDSRELELRFHEALSLRLLGLLLTIRGEADTGQRLLLRAASLFAEEDAPQFEGVTYAHLAQRALWAEAYDEAAACIARADDLAQAERQERDLARAARLAGALALGQSRPEDARLPLEGALARARQSNLVEEEILTLTTLAALHHRQGEPDVALALLDEVWEPVERGPYPLFHADALILLARIAHGRGDPTAAGAAAEQAYRLAWCDGPPYAYHHGLAQARAVLISLGLPEPRLPPFDTTRTGAFPVMGDGDLGAGG